MKIGIRNSIFHVHDNYFIVRESLCPQKHIWAPLLLPFFHEEKVSENPEIRDTSIYTLRVGGSKPPCSELKNLAGWWGLSRSTGTRKELNKVRGWADKSMAL
jgi:hypothetical protein